MDYESRTGKGVSSSAGDDGWLVEWLMRPTSEYRRYVWTRHSLTLLVKGRDRFDGRCLQLDQGYGAICGLAGIDK